MLSNILSFLTLAALSTASPLIKKQSGVQVISNCNNQGQIALTFDGTWTLFIRKTSKRSFKRWERTWFLNGQNYDCIYNHVEDVRYLDSQGHTIGSHTWSHSDLTTLSYEAIHEELARVEEAFIRILGKKPLYFRPPYGAYNDLTLQVLTERGYKKMFLWSDDSRDSSGQSIQVQRGVMDGVVNSYPEPKLVLQHSVYNSTEGLLHYTVPQLQERGYELVSVDTCLGEEGEYPYEYVGEPGQQDASWTC